MAEVKRVLVVDDHFEMLELLRSMLELSHEECEVLAVPSAEEGLLEFRRTHFDLVITDVRLPGMSGFDLVRRIQKLGRNTPVIMITAYSSFEGQKEANSLGVLRYFPKPLDTDAVLMSVQTALHGELQDAAEVSVAYRVNAATAVSETVRKRLQTLRSDTGATGLTLSTTAGQVLFEATTSRHLDVADLLPAVAQTMQKSFSLSQHLGSDLPNTIQYHAGEVLELYCANVGQNYFLTLFFDVQSRRGRIGTIWVFTQRAIKDLTTELPAELPPETPQKPPVVSLPKRAAEARPATAVKPPPSPPPAAAKQEADLVQDADIAAMAAAMIAAQENGSEQAAVEETAVADNDPPNTITDLDDLFDPDAFEFDEQADLDAFWDDALS